MLMPMPEAGASRVRPALPIAGDADHDQPRIDLRELVVTAAPLLQRAGSEVLQQEVGFPDQLVQNLLALRLTQIERDRLLVARDDRPPQRFAISLLAAPHAQRIALLRRLHFDD